MTKEIAAFDRLVDKLAQAARRDPERYKERVRRLAALGYGYILLLGALPIALLVYFFHTFDRDKLWVLFVLGVPLIVVFGAIFGALFVKFPPPEGKELKRHDVPHLFAFLDELTHNLAAPQPHCVLLTNEFNAAIAQRPRLGIFGWYRNYLILGLPLMLALSPTQFRAVLAHEFGHLSGNHSRFRGWIYRVRLTWLQTLEHIERTDKSFANAPVIDLRLYVWILIWRGVSWVISRLYIHLFFDWYVPRFNAHAFVLGREDEYEADRRSIHLVGKQAVAETLLRIHLSERSSILFWEKLWKRADREPDPPFNPANEWMPFLKESIDREVAIKFTAEALAVQTDNVDTHPCLSDRLAALGYSPPLPFTGNDPIAASAAETLLAEALPEIVANFDREWHRDAFEPWQARFRHAQSIFQALAELEAKAAGQPLCRDEAWQKTEWTADVIGKEEALPLMQAFLEQHPECGWPNYTYGQILLERGDRKGIGHIERAMQSEPEALVHGSDLILNFLKLQGDREASAAYLQTATRNYEVWVQVQQERVSVERHDRLKPHEFSEEEIGNLTTQLQKYPRLQTAYLAEKVLEHFPEKKLGILGIKRQKHFFEISSEERDREFVEQIARELEFPHAMLIYNVDGNHELQKKLSRIAAPIYGSR